MRHLCESGLRGNCTSRLSGGRRLAPTGASSDPTAVKSANKGTAVPAEPMEPRTEPKGNLEGQSTYVDAPCSARRNSNNFCGMRSGTVVCPASQMQHSCATGPYGVRGSEPNRAGGMLDSPTCFAGFPDPVSLTSCPYVVFRPNRNIRDQPRITASNRHPQNPVFQFRTAHFSSKQLFRSSGSRHRRPVTFLLDRQRPDDARHLVRQCDGDQLRRLFRHHPPEPGIAELLALAHMPEH